MRIACAYALLPTLLLALPAAAQDEMPALPDDEPGITTHVPEPAAGGVQKARTGTTVIGEQEAPIGLYIMPWRQSQALAGLDRPARLLDDALLPIDPEVFKRQVEYHRALTQFARDNAAAAAP